MSARLVAIEGIDGVGKGTQSQLLKERLLAEGYTSLLVSFPVYDSFFGKMIGQYLNGDYGTMRGLPAKAIALLYALDRWQYLQGVLLEPYDVVVFDRYVPSNLAHQGAKVEVAEVDGFLTWIMELEYTILSLPYPHLTILLNASTDTARQQVMRKSRRKYTDRILDIHEEDASYLERVRQIFSSLASHHRNVATINCEEGGVMRTVQSIAVEVFEMVHPLLPNKSS